LLLRGGLAIPQTNDTANDGTGFVCPNESCRRVFSRPLKTVLLGSLTGPFDACPYCLTKVGDGVSIDSPISEVEVLAESRAPEAEKSQSPPGCKRHFGYIGQKGAKDPIPDECLTCKEIVQCMLKKSKD